MSGDSYDKCPVCKNLPEKWRQGVDHLYGNVTREEFANIEKEYNELIRVECIREIMWPAYTQTARHPYYLKQCVKIAGRPGDTL